MIVDEFFEGFRQFHISQRTILDEILQLERSCVSIERVQDCILQHCMVIQNVKF